MAASARAAANDDAVVTAYSCRRCRAVLFVADGLMPHAVSKHRLKASKLRKDKASGVSGAEDVCSSLFLSDPTKWMEEAGALGESEGKLMCPGCRTRVGSFCWSGCQCSCGTWVTPAIQFPRSKVDPRRYLRARVPAVALTPDQTEAFVGGGSPVVEPEQTGGDAAAAEAAPAAVGADTGSEDGGAAAAEHVVVAGASPPPPPDPQHERCARHATWLRLQREGGADAALELLAAGTEDVSFEGANGAVAEGQSAVRRALGTVIVRLGERMEAVAPRVAALSSGATRAVFRVARRGAATADEDPFVEVGEVIFWSEGGAVQHVRRVLHPTPAFLEGATR